MSGAVFPPPVVALLFALLLVGGGAISSSFLGNLITVLQHLNALQFVTTESHIPPSGWCLPPSFFRVVLPLGAADVPPPPSPPSFGWWCTPWEVVLSTLVYVDISS